MYKLVIFNFAEGSFQEGFKVKLQITEKGNRLLAEESGKLPAAPNLPICYTNWQETYRSLEMQPRMALLNFWCKWYFKILNNPPVAAKKLDLCLISLSYYLKSRSASRIVFPDAQVTNVSMMEIIDNCQRDSEKLMACLQQWIYTPQFRPLRESFIRYVEETDVVRVLLQTEDAILQRLPWHLCDLFQDYPKAEVALCPPNYRQSTAPRSRAKVKILAILGNSEGIDLDKDRAVLEQLPNAAITFLVEPQRQQLNDQLWQQHWDILFFAGHSSSQGDEGRIYINKIQSLTIADLRLGLRSAVKNGLQLAIFNSCDGLGLAQDLANLQIPQTIVMRESVPDLVAQTFLKYFLTTLARGESFYLSVRRAREQLQWMEHSFPCATWLPVIYQHSAQVPFTWSKSSRQRHLVKAVTSGAIAALLTGMVQPTPATPNSTMVQPIAAPDSIAKRMSLGDKILVKEYANFHKKAGVEAFGLGKFRLAAQEFDASLKQEHNDPETLIYLNNAQIGKDSALKIAVSVPIGSNINVAEEILRGVAQAQDEVNRNGGINHQLLQVEIANDENQPAIAIELAERFVKDKDIKAAIGHNASDASVQAAPVYEQHQLVMISSTSFSANLSSKGDYIFRMVPRTLSLAKALSQQAIKSDRKTKIAVCADFKSQDNASFRDDFIAEVKLDGGQYIKVNCDLSAPDFDPRTAIADIISSGADSLLLAPHVDQINQALAVARANHGKLTLYGSPTLCTAQTLQGGQVDINGLILSVPWYPTFNPENSFERHATQLWGGPVNWRTAMSYDATEAIVAGLQHSSSRQGLQKTLHSPDFLIRGATGTIEFLSSGEREYNSGVGILVQVQPSSQTPFGYTFRPLP